MTHNTKQRNLQVTEIVSQNSYKVIRQLIGSSVLSFESKIHAFLQKRTRIFLSDHSLTLPWKMLSHHVVRTSSWNCLFRPDLIYFPIPLCRFHLTCPIPSYFPSQLQTSAQDFGEEGLISTVAKLFMNEMNNKGTNSGTFLERR